ncbi:hypothetical protein LTR64_000192 [Lithohypha guttulata]|uniref:uncharacterized protein n=1 Tax=Lithohypha guttulata TaxID=1690604 RepID=UPI002DDE3981|nr:hypothetical protein LTR51_007554 [Lithohypha guttulata]
MPSLNPVKLVGGASWLYPIKGIFYFLGHTRYYPLFRSRLIPVTLLSFVIYGILFTFAYLPIVAFLAIWHGPTAWINGAFLILGAGSAVIALLFEAFFVDETLVDTFDAVLVDQGCQELVSRGRLLDETAPNSVKSLGKPTISSVYSPFSFRQIALFVVTLPLSFIPIVGILFFLIVNGFYAGSLAHYRLYKLQGLSKKEQKKEVSKRKLKYTWFGAVHLSLQLVPGLSMLFLLTSAAGSGLWAAKLEKERTLTQGATIQPNERYEDEPV